MMMRTSVAKRNLCFIHRSARRQFSSIDPKLVVDDYCLDVFSPRYSKVQSNFLESLAKCKVKSISSDVDAIIYDSVDNDLGVECLGPESLFVRKFYPDLLKEIRKYKRSVLIGNPGIGKSFFQGYYLARIMNPSKFGALPPDCYGSTDPPSIVVRQMGARNMTIFDIANRKAVVVQGCPGDVLECFNPQTSLYLMEPESSVLEPHYAGLEIPTLTTVSPMLSRYKEFCKNGGIKLFMPTYELEELLAIAEYLLGCSAVPGDLVEEYTPEQVTKRFHQFGGIYRHVLPASKALLESVGNEQATAILECDAHALLRSGDVENRDVSHFIMQYKVVKRDGEMAFRKYRLDFVNDSVYLKIKDKLLKGDLDDKAVALARNDETGSMADACPKLYESLLAGHLTSHSGVRWKKREVSACHEEKGNIEWTDFSLKLDDIVAGELPSYADMKQMVLYMPLNPSFPFVDSVYKTEEGELVAFQVTRSKSATKKFKWSALKKFVDKIEFPVCKAIHLWLVLVPLPSLAEIAKMKAAKEATKMEAEDDLLDDKNASYYQKMLERYEVWELPENYSNGFT
jgi:hypothetical protein